MAHLIRDFSINPAVFADLKKSAPGFFFHPMKWSFLLFPFIVIVLIALFSSNAFSDTPAPENNALGAGIGMAIEKLEEKEKTAKEKTKEEIRELIDKLRNYKALKDKKEALKARIGLLESARQASLKQKTPGKETQYRAELKSKIDLLEAELKDLEKSERDLEKGLKKHLDKDGLGGLGEIEKAGAAKIKAEEAKKKESETLGKARARIQELNQRNEELRRQIEERQKQLDTGPEFGRSILEERQKQDQDELDKNNEELDGLMDQLPAREKKEMLEKQRENLEREYNEDVERLNREKDTLTDEQFKRLTQEIEAKRNKLQELDRELEGSDLDQGEREMAKLVVQADMNETSRGAVKVIPGMEMNIPAPDWSNPDAVQLQEVGGRGDIRDEAGQLVVFNAGARIDPVKREGLLAPGGTALPGTEKVLGRMEAKLAKKSAALAVLATGLRAGVLRVRKETAEPNKEIPMAMPPFDPVISTSSITTSTPSMPAASSTVALPVFAMMPPADALEPPPVLPPLPAEGPPPPGGMGGGGGGIPGGGGAMPGGGGGMPGGGGIAGPGGMGGGADGQIVAGQGFIAQIPGGQMGGPQPTSLALPLLVDGLAEEEDFSMLPGYGDEISDKLVVIATSEDPDKRTTTTVFKNPDDGTTLTVVKDAETGEIISKSIGKLTVKPVKPPKTAVTTPKTAVTPSLDQVNETLAAIDQLTARNEELDKEIDAAKQPMAEGAGFETKNLQDKIKEKQENNKTIEKLAQGLPEDQKKRVLRVQRMDELLQEIKDDHARLDALQQEIKKDEEYLLKHVSIEDAPAFQAEIDKKKAQADELKEGIRNKHEEFDQIYKDLGSPGAKVQMSGVIPEAGEPEEFELGGGPSAVSVEGAAELHPLPEDYQLLSVASELPVAAPVLVLDAKHFIRSDSELPEGLGSKISFTDPITGQKFEFVSEHFDGKIINHFSRTNERGTAIGIERSEFMQIFGGVLTQGDLNLINQGTVPERKQVEPPKETPPSSGVRHDEQVGAGTRIVLSDDETRTKFIFSVSRDPGVENPIVFIKVQGVTETVSNLTEFFKFAREHLLENEFGQLIENLQKNGVEVQDLSRALDATRPGAPAPAQSFASAALATAPEVQFVGVGTKEVLVLKGLDPRDQLGIMMGDMFRDLTGLADEEAKQLIPASGMITIQPPSFTPQQPAETPSEGALEPLSQGFQEEILSIASDDAVPPGDEITGTESEPVSDDKKTPTIVNINVKPSTLKTQVRIKLSDGTEIIRITTPLGTEFRDEKAGTVETHPADPKAPDTGPSELKDKFNAALEKSGLSPEDAEKVFQTAGQNHKKQDVDLNTAAKEAGVTLTPPTSYEPDGEGAVGLYLGPLSGQGPKVAEESTGLFGPPEGEVTPISSTSPAPLGDQPYVLFDQTSGIPEGSSESAMPILGKVPILGQAFAPQTQTQKVDPAIMEGLKLTATRFDVTVTSPLVDTKKTTAISQAIDRETLQHIPMSSDNANQLLLSMPITGTGTGLISGVSMDRGFRPITYDLGLTLASFDQTIGSGFMFIGDTRIYVPNSQTDLDAGVQGFFSGPDDRRAGFVYANQSEIDRIANGTSNVIGVANFTTNGFYKKTLGIDLNFQVNYDRKTAIDNVQVPVPVEGAALTVGNNPLDAYDQINFARQGFYQQPNPVLAGAGVQQAPGGVATAPSLGFVFIFPFGTSIGGSGAFDIVTVPGGALVSGPTFFSVITVTPFATPAAASSAASTLSAAGAGGGTTGYASFKTTLDTYTNVDTIPTIPSP